MSIALAGQLPCSCAIPPTASFGQVIDRGKDNLAPQDGRKTKQPMENLSTRPIARWYAAEARPDYLCDSGW